MIGGSHGGEGRKVDLIAIFLECWSHAFRQPMNNIGLISTNMALLTDYDLIDRKIHRLENETGKQKFLIDLLDFVNGSHTEYSADVTDMFQRLNKRLKFQTSEQDTHELASSSRRTIALVSAILWKWQNHFREGSVVKLEGGRLHIDAPVIADGQLEHALAVAGSDGDLRVELGRTSRIPPSFKDLHS